MWGLLLASLAALVAAVVVWQASQELLQPPRPRSLSPSERPCATAGPVLAAHLSSINLDGLTIIPITRLPQIRARIPLPLLSKTLVIHADLTASELVFKRLLVGSVATTGRDIGREPVELAAKDLDLEMTGSIGLRLSLGLSKPGATRAQDMAGRSWTWKPSGRLELALRGAAASVLVQLVQAPEVLEDVEVNDSHPSTARLACTSSTFVPGTISLLSLQGFFPFRFIETVTHHLRNTALVRVPTQHLVGFLVRKGVEGRIPTELLGDLAHFVGKHVHTEAYGSITRQERDDVLRRFYPTPPPAPSSSSATNPAPRKHMRFSALFYGETVLHSMSIPASKTADDGNGDAASSSSAKKGETPVALFSRLDATGLRYTLLSSPLLNQVTRGPPKATFGPGTFDRLAWSSAHIELAPAPVTLLEGSSAGPAVPGDAASAVAPSERELVLRVHGLDAALTLGFRLAAELRSAPSLLTGRKTLEERGVAVTRIGERALDGTVAGDRRSVVADDEEDEGAGEGISIHLPLRWDKVSGRVVLSGSFDAEGSTGGAAGEQALAGPAPSRLSSAGSSSSRRGGAPPRKIRLEGAFGTVAPRIKLESKLGKALGEKVVNALLDAVQSHLAALTAPLASYFLADVIRQKLQRALDEVAEKLQDEGGVIWSDGEGQILQPGPKVG
ncbi:hypothetical protein JCM3775_001353 [Rhodotorula graminis]